MRLRASDAGAQFRRIMLLGGRVPRAKKGGDSIMGANAGVWAASGSHPAELDPRVLRPRTLQKRRAAVTKAFLLRRGC